jgi:hypothetical protein
MTQLIPLTQGKVTLVDDADFQHLNQWKWHAQIMVSYKRIHLGLFEVKEDAARAYDRAAIKHFGPFAKLNFPEEYK